MGRRLGLEECRVSSFRCSNTTWIPQAYVKGSGEAMARFGIWAKMPGHKSANSLAVVYEYYGRAGDLLCDAAKQSVKLAEMPSPPSPPFAWSCSALHVDFPAPKRQLGAKSQPRTGDSRRGVTWGARRGWSRA